MKIRQYINYTMLLCLLAWSTQFMTGCSKSDYMDNFKAENATGTSSDEPPSDEVSKALSAVPGISDVSIQYSIADSQKLGYFFFVEQPKDHKNLDKGTFRQRCFLSFKDYESPVVLDTWGYQMPDSVDQMEDDQDLVTYLKANYICVEHRYFGKSLPEEFENLDFTYLYTDQAAADLHHVVTLLQKHLFPRANKWVSTGLSKGGITTALYAYYSDKNGWDDIDLYVPFCAPFLTGTEENCMDVLFGQYLINTCGSGYPEGSSEAIAYQRLRDLPAAITANKPLRDACLKKFHVSDPDVYKEFLDYYDGKKLEKAATAGVIKAFYVNLVNYFSYIPFSSWAKLVPDPAKAIRPEADIADFFPVVNFVFMGDKKLNEQVMKDQQKVTTRSALDDRGILDYRKNDQDLMVYSLQAYRELGACSFDYSLVDGTYLTTDFAAEVNYLNCVDNQFSKRYPRQWDGGQLMNDVHKWAVTTIAKPVIFVYSRNDPWTGGAIADTANNPSRKVWKVMNLIGIHSNEFLKNDRCNAEASQTIKSAINSVLNAGK